MNGILLSDTEENELYVLLNAQEAGLSDTLKNLLRRVERSLYQRLTIEDIERLLGGFS